MEQRQHASSSSSGDSRRHMDDETVATLYARVVQRVCSGFLERDTSGNADVAALLGQRWRERIECYTGVPVPPHGGARFALALPLANEALDGAAAQLVSTTADDETRDSKPVDTQTRVDTSGHAGISRIAGLDQRSQSIFAVMLSKKRKLGQIDGADDSDNEDISGDATAASGAPTATAASPPSTEASDADLVASDTETSSTNNSAALTTPSSEVAAAIAPAWGLPVTAFPTQLVSRYVRFRFRSKQRDLYGRVSGAVLTLTRSLQPRDAVRSGHLLWLLDAQASGDTASTSMSTGSVVEVVKATGDEMLVKLPDGSQRTVRRQRAQRFYELVVRKGVVQIATQ